MGMGCLYRVFIPREMEDNFLLTDNSKTKRASERQSEKKYYEKYLIMME